MVRGKEIYIDKSNCTDSKENAKNCFFTRKFSTFKTAMAGPDSNWGRIIMAIGKSGVKVDSKNISIKFGGNIVVSNGQSSKL